MIFASNEEEVMVGTIFAKYFFGKRITPYASHKELSYPWDTVILSGCCILIFGRIFSPDCSDVGTGHKSEHRPRNSARAKPGLSCIVSRSSTDFRALGGIQVLRHQRDGWVGWPNDDVWWQGGWVGVAKWWRDQTMYIKGKKKLSLHAQKTRLEFYFKKSFYMQQLFYEHHFFCVIVRVTHFGLIY